MPSASVYPATASLEPMGADEVILSFLKASSMHLSEDHRRRLDGVRDNTTYEEKLLCRAICRSMGLLQQFTSRHWYRALLEPEQLEFVRLGQESSNNFSKYFSRKTYRPCVAADRMRDAEPLTEKRSMHRDKVLKLAESIGVSDLRNVILCASRYTLNRQLKTFDGNHRIIAFVLKHGKLVPFECIVGFSKPFYVSLLQRRLLAFPVHSDAKAALSFFARNWLRRVRALCSGGEHYQPLLRSGRELRRLAGTTGDFGDTPARTTTQSERPCVDRARILRDDMRSLMGQIEGATLLDIGCNVGFFCHYFATLGMKATGIENSQHNRHQRFSLSNSVKTAKRMNARYGLDCDFIEHDARLWIKDRSEGFDVVLLLSVLHHFFLGYPVGEYAQDPMAEAYGFLEQIARITNRVLYLEYEDSDSAVSCSELIAFLRRRRLFRNVETIGQSSDFGRPIIRCTR